MKNASVQFEQFIKNMPRAQLGGLIKEYIAESNHCGWDGFSRHHRSGVNKLLKDIQTYYENHGHQDSLGHVVDNVNPVP